MASTRTTGRTGTLRSLLDYGGVWLARHVNRTPSSLPILVLMVTDKCNLKCKMCGACDYSPGDHNMLSFEEWRAVVDSAARLRTRIVSITGGEAMLRKDLFDLIAYIRGKGMKVHLNTNGLLLRDKNIQRLKECGVETVSISLESHLPEVHDDIRGQGMFQRTLEGLRRLREQAPEIRIGLNCVINKATLPGLHGLVGFAEREGVDQLKFAPIHTNLQHKDKPLESYEHLIFQETDIDALETELIRVRDALKTTSLQTTSDRFFAGMSSLYRPPASNFYCYAGYAICVVNPQGFVAACFDKDSALNVRERPLHEIWRSRAFHQHRQLVRNCATNCWDTTNAELSLRLSVRNLLREPLSTLRAVKFYYDELKNRPRKGYNSGEAATRRHNSQA